MQHSYQRYTLDSTLGLIASPNANVAFSHDGTMAVSGALEEVAVWNIKLGTKVGCHAVFQFVGVRTARRRRRSVQYLQKSEEKPICCWLFGWNDSALGYREEGNDMYDFFRSVTVVRLKGHKKAISALCFNAEGNQLASGSNDCTIVLWDLIGETGICRLKGHRDMVTSVLFIEEYRMLLSASKDTLLKVWSIDGQYCMDTFIGHRTEIWSIAALQQKGFKEPSGEGALTKYCILTGSSDQSLRLFNVYKEPRVLSRETEDATADTDANADADAEKTQHVLEYRGCVTVPKSGRTGQLAVDASGELLGYYVETRLSLTRRMWGSSSSCTACARCPRARRR